MGVQSQLGHFRTKEKHLLDIYFFDSEKNDKVEYCLQHAEKHGQQLSNCIVVKFLLP